MRATRFQTTLAVPCSVSGRGYWSGKPNTLTFVPAAADSGILFIRADLPGKPRVKAVAENRESMPLRTRLTSGAAEVDMVEHVLAALYGLQIDNAVIHCTATEMPGLDGSSHAYTLALGSVGKLTLPARRAKLHVQETLQVGNSEKFVRFEPSDSDVCEIEYQLDYGSDNPVGQTTYSTILRPETFESELAPARTFISQTEAIALQSQGIAGHVTERDLLVVGENGPINNRLRFKDEYARHKALDLVGDLALVGVDLVGRVVARRSGHQLNGQMAELLRKIQLRGLALPESSLRAA